MVIWKWEYENFWELGVAYAVNSDEKNNEVYNVTMIDYWYAWTKDTKNPCQVLGYWGDITTGPFYTFGLTVKHEE